MRRLGALLLCAAICLPGAGRQVAITIDDLPRGGDGGPRGLAEIRAMTERLLRPFHDQQVPVIGFVNAGTRMDFGAKGCGRFSICGWTPAPTWGITRTRIVTSMKSDSAHIPRTF